ncbi:DEAD/DEAH box helicase family protein [Parabacteroides goldsteinii]|uniref:DEAD/DEAH box helicase family protein n=1 Tax=Parabacteroides goldsteinii TaxID=328812 RepID=UPI003AEF7595
MLKTDIIWPEHRRYKSRTEWEPIGFFSDCLCNATRFDLKLGFFSTSAINVLADGFATFLHNGGRMRLIINDILSEQDKDLIEKATIGETIIPAISLDDIATLKNTLSERGQHFFDCIAWLIKNNRIEIKVIVPKDGNGISHTKCGLFADATNKVAFDGSCNFSRTALIENHESITAFCDWDSVSDKYKIEDLEEDFLRTFKEEDDSVKYLDATAIRTSISTNFPDKSIKDLLQDEVELLSVNSMSDYPISVKRALQHAKEKVLKVIQRLEEEKVKAIEESKNPRFPYYSGPRNYQVQAFENWKNNNQKGLFAMATGTGKTLTSLNCLLQIYNKTNCYKAIILVPTITLVEQWEGECKKFNFNNIVKVCSKYPQWQTEIDRIKLKETMDSSSASYIIISTYASFVRDKVFPVLNSFPKKRLLFIADEAHNMGSGRMMDKIGGIPYLRRIGLSATPKRQFDDDGNRQLYEFFGSSKQFTFEYSMQEAIDNGFLCRYYYYPHIVRLTDAEMAEYMEISRKLAKMYSSSKKDFKKGDDILKILLLKRKRIIQKAINKEEVFRQIVNGRYTEKGNLKYTLVYAPEGNRIDDNSSDIYDTVEVIGDDEETNHIIDKYTQIVQEISPITTVKKFTSDSSDRDKILSDFANGDLEVLTSMKCLDEGVDVPRSELAIFCASTGNPRQFIQRRGRILRTHKDKKYAYIHDLVVVPEISSASETFEMERSLLEGELIRVRDFALMSENAHISIQQLKDILEYYNLSIF